MSCVKFLGNSFRRSKLVLLALALTSAVSLLVSTSTYATDSIALTITGLTNNTLALDLIPHAASGTFAKSSDIGIGVSLSGIGGYTLGVKAGTTGASNTSLVNTTDSTKAFTSITSAISESDFTNAANTQYNNTWGYLPSKFNSANNTSFQPAPSWNGDILDYTETDNASGNYTLAIGARADLDTAVGSYENVFVITATANLGCNAAATSIGDALCMQDINDNVINSMQEDVQYRLKDNRDWKQYYIAKMQDGRVWMTQNLDLDLETTPTNVAALTHANTDLGWTVLDTNATWTPSTATTTDAAAYGANSATTPASFDYGDTYRYVSTTGSTTSYASTLACTTAHNDGTCPHYHVGNYYNWSAAVASNNTSSITANRAAAPDSICPAGWRLPAGKTSTSTSDSGYYGEINYPWVSEGLATNYINGTSSAIYATNGWINIRNNPMYMVAAGYKNGTSAVTSLGSYGYFWTNAAYNSTTAYAPYIYSSGLYPSYYSTSSTVRGRGLSIRCVARQSNTGKTTITYDKNASDATGTMSTQEINAATLGAVSANGYSRPGYTFVYWNTKADGTGTPYATNHTNNKYYPAKAGTENTNVTLYAIWALNQTITFDANPPSGTTASGTMSTQTINGNSSATLTQNAYTVTGYAFNSWNTAADGSGTRYTDKQSYSVSLSNTDATKTLYAQWDKTYTITFNVGSGASSIAFGNTTDGMTDYTNGQTTQAIEGKAYTIGGDFPTKYGFNTWTTTANGTLGNSTAASTTYTVTGDATLTLTGQEATTSINSITASGTTPSSTCKNETPVRNVQLVYDPRDNEAYWVGELCDGNVWMLDNLRLDLSNTTTLNGLSTTNTNASAQALECLKTGTYGGNACASPYATAAVINKTSGFSSYNLPYVNVNYKDDLAPVTYGVGSGKVGVYYNYCATSAGSYCYASGAGVDEANTYRDIESDICPAGWRLPSGNTNSGTTRITDYGTLYAAYSGATGGQGPAMRNALSTPLSGYFNGSSQYDLGAYGGFWSSTWGSTNYMYYLNVYSTNANPNSTVYRVNGRSIRCVLGSS